MHHGQELEKHGIWRGFGGWNVHHLRQRRAL
jgi:hypothetical protein